MAEFVRLCDEAIRRAQELKRSSAEAGDQARVALADRAISILQMERNAAQEGRIGGRSQGFGFGPTRFVSDNDWGPRGQALVEAVYRLQDHWSHNT
jgi:hypothetical protein